MKIEEIDKNFAHESISGIDLSFMPVTTAPMELDGLPFFSREHQFCRLPVDTLPAQNDGVQALAWHTAGVQLRFKTDSQAIALRAEMREPPAMSHMPSSGSSGFDIYLGTHSAKRFFKNIRPEIGQKQFTGLFFNTNSTAPLDVNTPLLSRIPGTNLREVTIFFPLYNGVKSVEIGLTPGAAIEPPAPFYIPDPILFYGSSITQGGCASRPGNAYFNYLCRRLDANIINYGFSGSGRAEPAMADVIASIKMSAFVMDYDHNAPDADYLQKTHQPFFRTIRERYPKLPVLFLTKCDCDCDQAANIERARIIKNTFIQAVNDGDRNVFFLDGHALFGISDRDACTVDGCHPNDIGFLRMADAIEPELRRALDI